MFRPLSRYADGQSRIPHYSLLRAGVRLRNVMTKANGSDDSVGFLNYRHYRAPFQCAATERRTKSKKIPIDAHSKMKGGAR